MSAEAGTTQETDRASVSPWLSEPDHGAGTMFGGVDAGPKALGGAAESPTNGGGGPFSPPVTSLLRNCFGHVLDDITVARGEGAKNRSIGAAAHTIGKHISLGDNIKEDLSDPHSMEVIAHEVAHALGTPGQRRHILDRAGDPGEHAAYDAGRQVRNFIQGGGQGAAPQTKPAHGGRAGVHRFEAGEHADAVDNAATLLKDAQQQGRQGAVQVDPKVASNMTQKIKLANGVEVTAGEITAMMGDFYGAFDKDGKFNPAKSFEALNNADPAEMQVILKAIGKEKESVAQAKEGKGEFKETDPGALEDLTKWRKQVTDADGTTTGFSMLELAKQNDSHFSKKDETGTDNNMGAYTAFHKMAMEAAAKGDKNKALALEASAQHFLTDRFAGGHQFDKQGLMEASGKPGLLSQGVARIVHNKYNKEGVEVGNENGETWTALGDSHWSDKENEGNRFQTAKAVYSSYSELQTALDGKVTPDQIKELKSTDLSAHKSVPKFDEQFQKKIEKEGADLTYSQLLKQVGPEALSAAPPTIQRWLINRGDTGRNLVKSWENNADSLNPMKALNWLKNTGGEALDGIKKAGGGAVDWLKDAGGEAWDGIKTAGGGAVDWLKDTGSQTLGGIQDAAGGAWNWLKNTAGGAWNAAKEGGVGGLWDFAKQKGGEAWGGIKDAAGGAWDFAKQKGGEAWGGIKDAAGGAWDFAKQKGGEAWGGLKRGFSAAKDLGGATWDFTKDMGGRAVDWGKKKIDNGIAWGKSKASQAWDGVKQFGSEVAETASETWSGAKQTVKNGLNTVKDTARSAWNGTKDAVSSGWGWLKKKAGF